MFFSKSQKITKLITPKQFVFISANVFQTGWYWRRTNYSGRLRPALGKDLRGFRLGFTIRQKRVLRCGKYIKEITRWKPRRDWR